ncbi:universal stress protein A-like protein, partial [Lycium ferocissimum]|uniref:universal stress protein A-like protein n=1 Tax=Lycium ferocissimum TaxID=112874 RepID=UPI00281540C3
YHVNVGFDETSVFSVAAPELVASVQENRKKMAEALLERAKDICIKSGVTPQTIAEVGDPKEAICAAVEKLNVQLLVLGSHNRKALERAFLGSVSNYCVHNAKCPVLLVRQTK